MGEFPEMSPGNLRCKYKFVQSTVCCHLIVGKVVFVNLYACVPIVLK